MILDHWESWLILIIVLLGLLYTLIVVMEEKRSFLETAKKREFQNYHFLIPSWWGLTKEEPHELIFERTDTRYDWRAQIQWDDQWREDLTIEEDFERRMNQLDLIFDYDSSAIRMPEDFKNRIEVSQGQVEIVRVEGTATVKGTDRCYMDAFLIRDKEQKGSLFATSLSSVLNGLVEGPYFEEMMLKVERRMN